MNKSCTLSVIILFSVLFFNSCKKKQVNPLDEGLVAYYPFNGDFKDESGNNNHGIGNGNLIFGASSKTTNGQAAYFNGTNSYVSIMSSSSLESPTEAITISAWLNINPTSVGAYFICKNSNGSLEPFQYRMGVHVNQYMFMGYKNTPTTYLDIRSRTNVFARSKWMLVTSTFDGKVFKYYIDGVLFSETPHTGVILPDKRVLEIGRDAHGPIEWFSGALDEVRIYNRALNESEVAQLYQ